MYKKELYCKYSGDCNSDRSRLLKCKYCRLNKCYEIGMKESRVNYYNIKSPEPDDSSSEERIVTEERASSVPIQYIIYAQVLETLIDVCKEDKQGTINFVATGDPRIQDIAAIRFQQNHSLENVKEKTNKWAIILDEFKITQEELPAVFHLITSYFSLAFYNFVEYGIQS
ncbi:hypothetical protein FO519_010284, partial [Halicephalobus sp. NKZ332]